MKKRVRQRELGPDQLRLEVHGHTSVNSYVTTYYAGRPYPAPLDMRPSAKTKVGAVKAYAAACWGCPESELVVEAEEPDVFVVSRLTRD